MDTPMNIVKQGAEGRIFVGHFYSRPCIIKERFSKSYRHPVLDKSLTTQRIRSEIRAMMRCRLIGVPTPSVYFVDMDTSRIYMEQIEDSLTVREYINMHSIKDDKSVDGLINLKPLSQKIGRTVAKLHQNNIIHGDLTTSNMLLKYPDSNPDKQILVLIDFGLSHMETLTEDKGVDLYVLERALLSTHPNTEQLFEWMLEAYKTEYPNAGSVLAKFEEVQQRGRKRTMVG